MTFKHHLRWLCCPTKYVIMFFFAVQYFPVSMKSW